MATVYLHPVAVAGIEPKISLRLQQGIWRVADRDYAQIPFNIVPVGDEKEWKEGSPVKIARTWFDAMAAEDWTKANSVSHESIHAWNANLLRRMRNQHKSGKDIPSITMDYIDFESQGNSGIARIYCSTAEEKYSLTLKFENDVWRVLSAPLSWPTLKFWEEGKAPSSGPVSAPAPMR